tara:strand:+ start:112 stop:561 length:450 start_codon:yes stop_codon:yes gene_type:complete
MIQTIKNIIIKIKNTDYKNVLYKCLFSNNTTEGKITDYILNIIILTSILLIFMEYSSEIFNKHENTLKMLEWIFTIFFTIEYGLRIYCMKKKSDYTGSFFGIIDLLAILPTYISYFLPGIQSILGIRGLRFLRLLRIFKFVRYLEKIYF